MSKFSLGENAWDSPVEEEGRWDGEKGEGGGGEKGEKG